jgi:hypothetical protein
LKNIPPEPSCGRPVRVYIDQEEGYSVKNR